MPIDALIADGKGSNKKACVTNDQELCTIAAPYPPLAEQKVVPFRQFLTDDGLSSGSNDMGVDGSSTSVDFYIEADDENDTYITTLNFIVAYGTSGAPYEWSDGVALTNGCKLFYESMRGEQVIHEGIKSNQDLFRLSFSAIPTAWEVRHVNALNDFGYFITMDLTKLGLPFGIKLDRKSKQKLTMRIQDNAGTDADTFDCIAYGFMRFQ